MDVLGGALLQEAYRQSWFVVPGSARLAVAFRSTRPCAPLADAIFLFVIAELMQIVQALRVPRPKAPSMVER